MSKILKFYKKKSFVVKTFIIKKNVLNIINNVTDKHDSRSHFYLYFQDQLVINVINLKKKYFMPHFRFLCL